MLGHSASLPRWLVDAPAAAVIAPFTLFITGIAVATFVALLVIARVRANFLRQAKEIEFANRRFQATFDQAAVGISHMDAKGRWIRVNDRFCEIVGYAPEELLTLSFRDVTHPDDLASDLEIVGELVMGKAQHRAVEKRYIRKDGNTVWVNVTRSIVRDGGPGAEFIVSVIEDISARKEAEERLVTGEAELRRLQNEFAHLARVNDLGEMAAAIAHEINQPLAAIVNYLNSALFLAKTGYSEANFGHVVDDMSRASEQALRAGDIVRQLRAFISQGAGLRTPVSADRLVDSAMDLALIDAKYAGITVEKHVEKGLEVEVDTIQIHQVMVNLLRNAVDAMTSVPPGRERRLTVTVQSSEDDMVSFIIADTGPGISPEIYERLFQPFVTSKSNGMGMGLSVCQRLIEAHGGMITAENRPGSGAIFTFRLPRFLSNKTAE